MFRNARHSLELAAAEPGDDTYAPWWLSGADDALLADGLRAGLTLRADNVSLRLACQQVVPLRVDPRVGALTSRARVEPGEMHWILFREDVADLVADYLSRVAGGELDRLSRGVPEGWGVYRNVVIDARGPKDVPPALAPLVPAVDARPEFHGGLALRLPEGGKAYLKGGEPDLWVPDWLLASSGSRWRLDGIERHLVAEVQPLTGIDLGEGTHAVQMSDYRLTFRVVEAVASWPREEAAFTTIQSGVPRHRGEGDPEVRVCGARILAGHSAPDSRPPVLLPYGGIRYTLLGATPGEVQSGPPPVVPEWLADVGLLPKAFEVFPSFTAVWAIIDWPHAGREARALGRLEPRPAAGAELERRWAEELLEPASLHDPASYDLWRSFREHARPLVATPVGS